MHIMTAEGWKPLAVKSEPAPRDKSLLELSGLGKYLANRERFLAAFMRGEFDGYPDAVFKSALRSQEWTPYSYTRRPE